MFCRLSDRTGPHYLYFVELLQPHQPEGQGGGALIDPVPVRRASPNCSAQQWLNSGQTREGLTTEFGEI